MFEEEDDDPFYELYSGNKLTFLEKKGKNTESKYKQVEYSNESVEDLIRVNIPRTQEISKKERD